MTHDPLCLALDDQGFSVAYFGPAGSHDDIDCLCCYFIAKVRADTLDKAEEAVDALVFEEAFNSDIAAEDAIAAINSLRGQS
jgi:hypothetical protein